MFKNLVGEGLGVSGRQNEMIELALTYGFRGIDIDMNDMVGRAMEVSQEFACQYLNAAQKALQTGAFEVPVDLRLEEEKFRPALNRLKIVGELVAQVGCKRAYIHVPASSNLPFQENFERYQARVAEVATELAQHEIKIGLSFDGTVEGQKKHEHKFITNANELATLVKTVGADNVGVLLDGWHWTLGGGSIEDLNQFTADQIICVRLADLPEGFNAEETSAKDRLIPVADENGISVKVLKWLNSVSYEGPIAACPNASQFTGMTREKIVQRLSEALNEILPIAGVDEAVTRPAIVSLDAAVIEAGHKEETGILKKEDAEGEKKEEPDAKDEKKEEVAAAE